MCVYVLYKLAIKRKCNFKRYSCYNKKLHITKRCTRFYEEHFETLLKNIKDPNKWKQKP